jgi:OOP family OmpA-OmpF porin
MRSSNRRFSVFGVFMLAGVVTLSGCATRGYVDQQIAPVQARVAELESTTEEHAERIDAVDNRAQQGIAGANTAAQAAQTAADAADAAAADADRMAEAAQESADQATNRVGTLENRFDARNNYSVAQTVSVTFGLESADLSDGGMATLGRIAGQVQSGDFLEVQGYTDATGDDAYNIALSQRRAGAVQRYLVAQNVPLFRIEMVGLGEANPAAGNDTREGREQNRRVEVRLLRAAN